MKHPLILFLVLLGLLFVVFQGMQPGKSRVGSEGLGSDRVIGSQAEQGMAAQGRIEIGGDLEQVEPGKERSSLDQEFEPSAMNGEAEELGLLRGRVLDRDMKPVSHAEVSVGKAELGMLIIGPGKSPGPEITAHTDKMGRFELSITGSGRSTVKVRSEGYLHWSESFYLDAGAEFDVGDLVLEFGYGLRGRVMNARGAPLEGVAVSLLPPSEPGAQFFSFGPRKVVPIASTDADGIFAVTCMPQGPYELSFDRVDLLSVSEVGVLRQGAQDSLDIHMEEGAVLSGQIERGDEQSQEFTVVAWMKGVFMPGMQMVGGSDSGPSPFDRQYAGEVQDDGSFQVRGLPWEKAVQVAVFASEETQDPLGPAIEVQSDAKGVALTLFPLMDLKLRVVSAGDRLGIDAFGIWAGFGDARPLLDDQGGHLRNHPGGEVTYPRIRVPAPDAPLTVRIDAPGFAPFLQEGLLPPVDGVLELGQVALVSAPGLRIRVLADESSLPLKGVRVRVREIPTASGFPGFPSGARFSMSEGGFSEGGNTSMTVLTNQVGEAQFSATLGSSYAVTIEEKGYARMEQTLSPTQANLVFEARLLRPCTVEVILLDERGEPKVAGRVAHQAPDNDMEQGFFGGGRRRTDVMGKAVFRHLQPGTHGFRASGSDSMAGMIAMTNGPGQEELPWQSVTLAPGETRSLTLRTKAKGTIRGRVLLDGQPLAQCKVSFQPDGAEMFFLGSGGPGDLTAGDGSFKIEGLDSGQGRLTFAHGDLIMRHEQEYTCVLGEQVVDVDLVLTSVSGRVVGPDGRGLGSMEVTISEESKRSGATMIMISGSTGSGAQTLSRFGGADSVRTAEDGSYILRGVRAGIPLKVEASGEDLITAIHNLNPLKPGGSKQGVDLTLRVGASLLVTRTPSEGEGFSMVRLKWMGPQPEGARVDNEREVMGDGTCRFEGLTPGQWQISLEALGSREPTPLIEPRPVELKAGEHHEVTLD